MLDLEPIKALLSRGTALRIVEYGMEPRMITNVQEVANDLASLRGAGFCLITEVERLRVELDTARKHFGDYYDRKALREAQRGD